MSSSRFAGVGLVSGAKCLLGVDTVSCLATFKVATKLSGLYRTGKPASSHRRQQILALEYFVVDAWTQLQSKALQIEPAIFKAFVDEIIQRLLDIMKLQQRATSGETYMEGVAEVAALTLTAALKVIPVERFITAIQQVMSSRDETVCA
jgi:hypothetical protein